MTTTIPVLTRALAALDLGKHEGCGCSECRSAVRARADARAELICEIARLTAVAEREAAVAAHSRCRTPGCPGCGNPPARLDCEFCDQPLHPDRDCRHVDLENAEVLPARIPGPHGPLTFIAPDRTEES